VSLTKARSLVPCSGEEGSTTLREASESLLACLRCWLYCEIQMTLCDSARAWMSSMTTGPKSLPLRLPSRVCLPWCLSAST